MAGEGHVGEDHGAEHRRDHQREAGDELRAAIADPAAKEAGDDGRDQRQKDGGDVHPGPLSPSSG